MLADLLVRHGDVARLDRELLVLGQIELRLHLDLRGERATGLRGELHLVDALQMHHIKAGLLDGLGIELAEARAGALLGYLAAETILDDGRRHLALAKTWHRRLAQEHAKHLLVGRLDLFRIDLHGERDYARSGLFFLKCHFSSAFLEKRIVYFTKKWAT